MSGIERQSDSSIPVWNILESGMVHEVERNREVKGGANKSAILHIFGGRHLFSYKNGGKHRCVTGGASTASEAFCAERAESLSAAKKKSLTI